MVSCSSGMALPVHLTLTVRFFQLHTLLRFRKGRGQAQAQAKHQRQQRRCEFSDLHFIPSFTAPALSSTPEEWFLHR